VRIPLVRNGLLVAFVVTSASAAQPVHSARRVSRTPAATRSAVSPDEIQQLQQQIRALGPWQEQHRLIVQATENLWRRNRWDSEPDRFARRVAIEVSAIPPWKFQERMNKLTSMLAERYGLTPEQSAQFRARLLGAVVKVTWKHAEAIMQYSREMVQTRLAGKSFTAEQVARWARLSEPLLRDIRREVRRFGEQFGSLLDARQRELFRRDLASLQKRLEYVAGKMPAWERGEWTPADWGLEKDALHAEAAGRAEAPSSRPAAVPERVRRPSRPPVEPSEELPLVAEDESAWARYVREFIERYSLDEAQQVTARSVLAELEGRAKEYREAHADELARIEQKLREAEDAAARAEAAHQREELLRPIADLFEELKQRLDRLPTDAQRRQAGE